jgi:nitrate reductase gamma subunit
VANVASILSSDQADNHFATLADGVVLVIGIALLCARRLSRGRRILGAILAICSLAFLVFRIVNGTI